MPPITPSLTDLPDESVNIPSVNIENSEVNLSDSDSLSDSEIPNHYGYAPLPQDPENVVDIENTEEDYTSGPEVDDLAISAENNLNLCSQNDTVPVTSQNSNSTISTMDDDHIETIKTVMKGIKLPTSNLPSWASQVPEEEWKAALLEQMQKRGNKIYSSSTGTHSNVNNSLCDMSCEVLR